MPDTQGAQFSYLEVAALPPLAWCARLNRGNTTTRVYHGSLVETRPTGFIEGVWDGPFAPFDFIGATVIGGTGASVQGDQVRFTSSTDRVAPLFSIVKAGSMYVSNSPAFVMRTAGEEPDDIYPFYQYDLLRIFRQGLYRPEGRLRLRSATTLRVHFMTIMSVDRRGRITYDRHRLCEAPRDYRSYKAMLLEGVNAVLKNGADAARKRHYAPLASISRGYDSTATSVLAASSGCTEAFTYTDGRKSDPGADSGAANAVQFLGMRCHKFERWKYLEMDGTAEAEFGYSAVACRATLAPLQSQLSGRILILGDFGEDIWEPRIARAWENLTEPWARFTLGLSPIEFRLRVGYYAFAPTFIAARHNGVIHAIATSDEMRGWSVGGDYDRPIARRIAEEAGIPRDRFGAHKAGSGHCHLNHASGFSREGLRRYGQFVRERHAGVPRYRFSYWHARLRWRHQIWRAVCTTEHRYVPSTALRRHFPFITNVTPITIPWDYLFTFQWTVASMLGRYSLPREAAPSPGQD